MRRRKTRSAPRATLRGCRRQMRCGLSARVIRDWGSENIDVRFEDGATVRGCTRSNFRGGHILHPSHRHPAGRKEAAACKS